MWGQTLLFVVIAKGAIKQKVRTSRSATSTWVLSIVSKGHILVNPLSCSLAVLQKRISVLRTHQPGNNDRQNPLQYNLEAVFTKTMWENSENTNPLLRNHSLKSQTVQNDTTYQESPFLSGKTRRDSAIVSWTEQEILSSALSFGSFASSFYASTPLLGWQEGHPACKKSNQ